MDNEKIFIVGLIAGLSIVGWLMVSPFMGWVMGAVLLAFLLHPLQKKFRELTGPRISAVLLMTFTLLLAIIPLLGASLAIVEDAREISSDLNENELIQVDELEQQIFDLTGRAVDIDQTVESTLNSFINTVFGNFSRIFNLATNILIGFTLMMFLLYYLLKDGENFVEWVKELIPVSIELKKDLFSDIEKTTWAVIKGHVLVSIIQGMVAGIGLWVVGIPNVLFWTFLMVILGFIPLLGSMIIWLPAALYLIAVGQLVNGVFLLIFGFVVVGLVDNIVRPIAVDRGANIHPAVVILGVLGGVFLMGPVGLFLGPVLLGVLKSALTVFGENYS